ncbi:MAG: PKD domain-containing protein [Rhodothermales bacterium]|nr:PKD domain-containing protein [Rhodothermales bacterium]
MRHILRSLLLLLFATAIAAPAVQAQVDRGEDTVFLRPRLGAAYYLGDTEKSPFTFDGDLFNTFPYSLGAEVGYQFNKKTSLGLGFTYANYANITEFVDELETEDHPTTRSSVELTLRHLFSPENKLSFYGFTGLHYSFGTTAVYTPGPCLSGGACPEEDGSAFGPQLGLGLDIFLNRRASFFLESGVRVAIGDDQMDGYDDNGFGGMDFLGHNAVGFNINLNPFTPVEVTDLICPTDVVDTGDAVTFTASTNEDASRPVDMMWRFGDGGSASGPTVSHAFDTEGTYDVVFTATNGGGKASDSMTCSVVVEDPCVEAEIVSMSASNMNPDTQTSVRFSANITGSPATAIRWDFGDGNTATGASPSHTFSEPGTYTVTLEVENCGGTVTRTITVTVTQYEAAICSEITEMNSVFFDANSSALTDEGRAQLRENLEILQLCPNLNARVEGWAAAGERRPQQLSEDRARAVEQFYVDNGIAASRLVTSGMGRAEGGSKKEGLAQFRRADTIPVR